MFDELIASEVHDLTKYGKTYAGEVTEILDKGRIKIKSEELGWVDVSSYGICEPRQLASLIKPKVGQWVEISFDKWDPDLPVYGGIIREINEGQPSQSCDNIQVLFEDPTTGDYIILDQSDRSLKGSFAGSVKINGDSRSLVTHAELDSALQTFITALNLHVHSGVTTGPGSSGPPTSMSIDITSSKTDNIKVGNG